MTSQASAIPVSGTGGVVSASPCTFRGVSIAASAAATVTIFDNASAASGTIVYIATFGAAGSTTDADPDGVRVVNGLFMQVSAGTVSGSVRIG